MSIDKWMLFWGVFMVALPGLGCSGITRAPAAKTVTLSDLRQQKENLGQEIVRDGLIIHVPAGETVPLELDVLLPFAQVAPGENQVRFTKDIYLYVSKKAILLSPDGVSFAPIHKFKSIKRLFGASRGTLQIGFSADKEKGPSVAVGVALR